MDRIVQQWCKKLLPYRIYFSLFLAYKEMEVLKHQLAKVDKNCRNLAKITDIDATLRAHGTDVPFNDYELSIYSQNGEDGLLRHLFSLLGVTNKTFVEFGVEDGKECNAANLLLNNGWNGLLIDGSPENVDGGRSYYDRLLGGRKEDLKFLQAFVTAENINQLISSQNITGEIDLLSIDIDGNDYWVWNSICSIQPRVVVIEYNASLGCESYQTIQYDSKFVWASGILPDLFYTGASLQLLNELAREKGYILVGCDSCGVNAFFVRKDIAEGKIAEVSVKECFRPHAVRTARFGLKLQAELTRQLDFTRP